MRTRTILIGAMFGAVIATSAATATTIQLDLDLTRDPQNATSLGGLGDGSVIYGTARNRFFFQTFRARVLGDNGTAVTGCLDGGAQISLVDQAGVSRGVSGCANPATGLFEILPAGAGSIQTPSTVVARLAAPATAAGGTVALSAADSNKAIIRVQPRIIDQTPATALARRYPIRVKLDVPPPRPAAGVIVLQRKKGTGWVTIVAKRPDAFGRFSHTVALTVKRTVFRIRFNPAKDSGWLKNEGTLTLTRT